jgi:hypothetical protein
LHPQLERPAQLILEVEEHHRSVHEDSVDLVLKAFFKDKSKQAYHGWFMQGIRDIRRLQIITVVEMLWRDGLKEKRTPLCASVTRFEVHILAFDTRNPTSRRKIVALG